ncbi:unnamed protein product [[Candida] boidinii]|nr:unnamed protein product [[Candida] boidinii]
MSDEFKAGMLSFIRIWHGYNGILPTATENTADADAVTGHPDGGGDGDEIKQVNKPRLGIFMYCILPHH